MGIILNKIALYPGTFDPITNGHFDIIERALGLFNEVIVAVAISADKKPMFTLNQRIEMANKAIGHLKNVQVVGFDNLTVELAKTHKASIIIRGLRAVSDFEYELQMGYANKSLDNEIDTIYLMPNLQNAFISSSVVRSILKYNGDVSHLVPKEILEDLKCI